MVQSRTIGYTNIGEWVDVTSNSIALAFLESVDPEPTDAAGDRQPGASSSSSSSLAVEAPKGFKAPPAGQSDLFRDWKELQPSDPIYVEAISATPVYQPAAPKSPALFEIRSEKNCKELD